MVVVQEELDPNDGDLYRSPTRFSLGHCEDAKGQEQQQETRAGGGKPLYLAAGPGPIMEVTHFDKIPVPSLMPTPPMCGLNLMNI